ncbi:MAG: uroporphyrinogen-III synthase, partial [Holophagales bacterium]|nr:uroporphyrinogen-III synthase [Holophagales bacterium]
TADACRQAFGRSEMMPSKARAEALAAALAESLTGAESGPTPPPKSPVQVVLATADRGRRVLEDRLGSMSGVRVHRFEVYTTEPILDQGWPTELAPRSLDGLFFASPSAVEGFAARVATLPPAALPSGLRWVAIGTTTAAALHAAGSRGDLAAGEVRVAEQPTCEGLWQAFSAAGPTPPSNLDLATPPAARSLSEPSALPERNRP